MSQGSLEGFVGRFGAGKTLLMTHKGWRAHKEYDEVWTNYGLNEDQFDRPICRIGSGAAFFDMLRDALDVQDGRPEGTKRLVMLDEIHSLFDARGWANVPLEALTPLSQLRKAGVTIFFTSQHESQIEKRLRNYCNFLWLCRCWGSAFNFRRDAPLVFWAKCYDAHDFRKPGAEDLGTHFFRLSKKKTRLYDTFEVIERMDFEGVGVLKPAAESAA